MPALTVLLVEHFATFRIAGLIGAAALIAVVVAAIRRRGGSGTGRSVLLGCVLFSAGTIVVFTLLRDGWPMTLRLHEWNNWSDLGWRRLTYRPSGTDIVANGLLFVPLGFFLTLLTHRPAVAFVGSAAGSVAVELLQAVTLLGVPDVSDVIANSTGALAGALVATLVLAGTPVRCDRTYRRSTTVLAVATAVTLLALLVVVPRAADARQDRLRAELTAAFADSDAAEYEEWERADVLGVRVFDRASVRINGNAFPDCEHRDCATTWGLTLAYDRPCGCPRVDVSAPGGGVHQAAGRVGSDLIGA